VTIIRGVASLEGDNSVVFHYLKSSLIRRVTFGQSDLIRGELLYAAMKNMYMYSYLSFFQN